MFSMPLILLIYVCVYMCVCIYTHNHTSLHLGFASCYSIVILATALQLFLLLRTFPLSQDRFRLFESAKRVKFRFSFGALRFPFWGFPGGSMVKNSPSVQELQEMWIESLHWKDPLE